MKIARTLLFLTVALLVAVPAMAETITLKASAAVTAAGQGSLVNVGLRRHITISVNVTAGSGTVTTFRVWLEGTPDGATWFELPCDLILKAGATAPGAAGTNDRDIVNETSVQTSAKYVGVCQVHMDAVRAAWNVVGTSPSETFVVLGNIK